MPNTTGLSLVFVRKSVARIARALPGKVRGFRAIIMVLAGSFLLGASPASADKNLQDACTIMSERPGWYTAATDVSRKWDVPVSVILAVIYQESRFKAFAEAERSSAFGFAQALDGTWGWYKQATNAANAKRTSFTDSADFIAWYLVQTRERIGLPISDIASHYIAYHEGHAGFRSSRWTKKLRLMDISQKVAGMAARYDRQLRTCNLPSAANPVQVQFTPPRPAVKPFALAEVVAVLPRRKPADALIAEVNLEPNSEERALF